MRESRAGRQVKEGDTHKHTRSKRKRFSAYLRIVANLSAL